MTSRRQFLQTGLLGSLLLGAAGCSASAAEAGRRAVLTALVPAFVATLPSGPEQRASAVARTVSGVEKAIAGLAPTTQAEIGQLFALLAFPPTRVLVAGVWPAWETARVSEVAAFLAAWRHSRFDLLRTGYAGLHDLVLGAWYAHPDAWTPIGYPGPPTLK